MDRRLYQRARLGIESGFFIKENPLGMIEVTGIIEDISEGGIRFRIEKDACKDIIETIQEGSLISFQAYDEYKLYQEMIGDVLTGEVEVIRLTDNDKYIVCGCRFKNISDELAEYIKNKKVSIFMDSNCESI